MSKIYKGDEVLSCPDGQYVIENSNNTTLDIFGDKVIIHDDRGKEEYDRKEFYDNFTSIRPNIVIEKYGMAYR
jgi:hypothetical protein